MALATALSAWTHAGLLYVGLQRRGWIRFDATVVFVLLRTLLACVGLGAGLVLGMVWLNGSELTLQQWLALPGLDRSLRIIVVCMVGLAGYALILLLLGVRPRHFLRAPE